MDDWLENGTKAIGEEFENFIPLNERILQAIEKTGLLPHWTDRGSYEEE